MRSKHLLLSFLFVLLFFNTALFSQTSGNAKLFTKVFSADSLSGFDEDIVRQMALGEGIYGDNYITFLNNQKRFYINTKYNLWEQSFAPDNNPINANGYNFKVIGSGNSISNAPCTNEDFELGNLSGWTASVGVNPSSQIYPTFTSAIVSGPQVSVVTTPILDPYVGTIPNSPLGGTKVARINNTTIGTAAVVRLSQTFSVTATNYLYDFAYWAVMENAAQHSCLETPYMAVRIRNFTGTLQACPNFSIVAPSTGIGGCAGIGPLTWTNIPVGGTAVQTSVGWRKFSIDLTPYLSQNVTVEVLVGHCSLTGHFGYAYFDSNCNTMNLTVNGTQTISMPGTTVTPQVLCGTTATMMAPSGLGPYSWTGPAGSGITSNTNQTIATSVAGNYTLNMSPPGICNPPLTKIIALAFVPPTTVVATPSNICTSGSNSVATLSASGALQYTWAPGGSTLATIAVSPVATTIYTLTAKTGTCVGTYTVQVNVNPDPNVSITNSSPTVCVAASATLQANGASTYLWNTGSTSNPLIVSPAVATNYTVVGTSTAGCIGSATTNVGVSGVPTPTLFNISVPSTICVGGAVTMVAAGPYTFTWFPTGVTGAVVSLSPTVTTNYTVIAAAGSCTNTGNITVTVDPGPTMTLVSSPALVCPGNTATLSSIAPTATGFTWTPGGLNTSSITVSPLVTTNYSVTGVNVNGCKSTYTINQVVSPVPNITITPSSPSLCIGTTLTLTASGGATYTWNPGNIVNASAVVSPTSNTTYTVIASNGVCTSSLTTFVTVIAIPIVNATASPTAICSGLSTNLSASGATNYTWMPGSLIGANVSVSPTLSTTYTLTGSAGGCSSNTTIAVVVNPLPSINVVASPTAVCPGFCSTLTPSGASTYTMAGGFVVCPTVTTIYSVLGTSSLGCISANPGTVSVIVNPAPTISLTASTPSICIGGNANLTAGGATSYSWQPGNLTGANVTVSPTITTVYTVTGMSAAGCLGQNTISLIVVPIPTVNVSASSTTICSGSSTSLTALGACSYTWFPGSLSGGNVVVSPTTTTTYTVNGSCSGCASSTVITITVNNGPVLIASASPTSICPGGSSTLSVLGGSSYTWNPGGLNTASIVVNPTITTLYTVTGGNGTGCFTTATVNLVVNANPVIAVNPSSFTICAGSSASLSAIGALSYTWNPGSLFGSGVSVSPTLTTTYTVTGVNASGCIGQNTVSVFVLPIPTITITNLPGTVCVGVCSTLTATGATNYTWLPSGLVGSSAILCPTLTTTYTVLGSGLFGCTGSSTTTIFVNGLPNITASSSPTSICAGSSAILNAIGAVSYTWQPVNLSGSSVTVSPVATTLYTVFGTNASGCVSSRTVNLVVNSIPVVSVNPSSFTICAGGFANLSANGAASYTWNPGNLSGANVSVSPTLTTTYTVFGANAGGCVGQNTVIVNVLPVPTLTTSATSTLICSGLCTTLTAGGATSYTWIPGGLTGSTAVFCPTVPTAYAVTGSNGVCSSTAVIVVIVNNPPTLSITASPTAICAGGSSNLSASGATSYTWQPGSITGSSITVSPLATTIYTVTGANASGCSITGTISVQVNPTPTISISPSNFTICQGGFVNLSAIGGVSYTWTPSGTISPTLVASPTITTVYTVNGNNAFGCSAQGTATVFVTPIPTLTVTALPSALCSGGCTTLSVIGAASYTWNPGNLTGSSIVVCPTVTTTYTVGGNNGCFSAPAIVNVTVNAIPNLIVTSTNNTICAGSSATLTGSGTLTYTWSPGLSTNSTIVVSPTSTTVYTLSGSNGTGCNNTTTFTLSVVPTPTVNASASTASICAGFTTALTATGANTYTWFPSGATGSLTIESPSFTTTYTVVGENSGCTSTATLTILVVPLPVISVTANPANVCAGFSTTLTANGALTYTWLPSFATGSSITDAPITTTTYTVAGIAASGCPNFTTITVFVLPTPTVNATSSSASICVGSSATLTANGAASYSWIPVASTNTTIVVNPTITTTYTLIGDNGGCSDTTTVILFVNPLPSISPSISPSTVCSGNTVSLSASGAVNYTWNPIGLTGSSVIDNPTISLTYTVIGQDANGCSNQSNITVSVNPNPTLIATASPTAMCQGSTVTLIVNGSALSYTWNPTGLNTATITDTPGLTTTYTVSGTDAIGCIGSETVQVSVIPNPTLSVSPLNTSICAGSPATLTATGATNYTWLPSGTNSSITIESPTVNTTYTVIGDNGGICSASYTVNIFVNPLPANIIATSIGTITCANPTVALTGSSTDTNVSYSWAGPLSYNSTLQNPTVTVWGNFTLSVTNTLTGCVATVTINVPTDNSIPSVTATTSGSITCAVPSVTLDALNVTASPGYSWSGPSGFTSTLSTIVTTLSGVFTVTVTDLSSTCSATAMVSVGVHTFVPITATITAATCTGNISNNDGKIVVSNFGALDKYDLVSGSSYTGTVTYTNAIIIPVSGIITSNLANPTTTLAYTIRFFDAFGCFKDTSLILRPTDCSLKSMGIAKAVSSLTLNADGTYDVSYKVVVKNYDVAPLSNVLLTENLALTFPAPTTFSIVSPPVIGSAASSLVINNSFDGINQTNITTAATSTLSGNAVDSISFTVRLTTNGFFGPFKNSIVGFASNSASVAVKDSSNAGLDPDSDGDLNPNNNSVPTTFTLAPKLFFGITKMGEVSSKLDNNTFNISYSITVHNLGNDTLYNVVLKDSLFEKTIKAPANYIIKTAPVANGNLAANPLFDGKTDINLLDPLNSKMPPGFVNTITFMINVNPDTVSTISNSAYGNAIGSNNKLVSDTSNAGSNPDSNGNGIWNEPADNIPTVLTISNHTLFIPQGFTPNGDGKNDLFVIKGLPSPGENAFTVFNRWGNKVYFSSNYENTWDGQPNVGGALGNNKLPQGTYFYILDMKGSGIKPITGFIVVQY